jgi:hypothetical protein
MFELMTDRIAGTVLMGLDVAVEFATLGEYRLVEADAPAPDDFQPAPLVRRPAHLSAVAADQKLLPPASTAIARAAAESAARAAARRAPARPPLKTGASRAVIPSAPRRRVTGPAPPPVATRKRPGTVETGKQLCLFGH